MISIDPDTKGPFIVWTDYGPEGYDPASYDTLVEAVAAAKSNSFHRPFVITRPVVFKAVDDVGKPNEPSNSR